MQGPEGSSVSWCFHLLPFLLLAWTCCPAPLPSRNGEPGLPSLCQHHRGGLRWRQRLVVSGTISARNISDSSSRPISSLPPPSTKINGISLVASEAGMEMAYVVPTMFTINQKVVPYKMTMLIPLLLQDRKAFGSECIVNTLGKHPFYRVKALGRLVPDVMQPWHLIWP